MTNSKDGTTLSGFAYTYYASGSQKTETDNTGKVTSYVYDDLGRLTQESENGGLTIRYTYDANGNRSQMAVTGSENYTTNKSLSISMFEIVILWFLIERKNP